MGDLDQLNQLGGLKQSLGDQLKQLQLLEDQLKQSLEDQLKQSLEDQLKQSLED